MDLRCGVADYCVGLMDNMITLFDTVIRSAQRDSWS